MTWVTVDIQLVFNWNDLSRLLDLVLSIASCLGTNGHNGSRKSFLLSILFVWVKSTKRRSEEEARTPYTTLLQASTQTPEKLKSSFRKKGPQNEAKEPLLRNTRRIQEEFLFEPKKELELKKRRFSFRQRNSLFQKETGKSTLRKICWRKRKRKELVLEKRKTNLLLVPLSVLLVCSSVPSSSSCCLLHFQWKSVMIYFCYLLFLFPSKVFYLPHPSAVRIPLFMIFFFQSWCLLSWPSAKVLPRNLV